MSHLVQLEVLNWEKFNPRSDRANYSWLRLQNNFFIDHKIFDLTGNAQRVFIAILCECSIKGSASVTISTGLLGAILRVPEDEVAQCIRQIASNELVVTPNGVFTPPTGGEKPADGHQPVSLLPTTNVRTDERTHTLLSAPLRLVGEADVCVIPDLKTIWNENCGLKLPHVKHVRGKRLKVWKKRWQEDPVLHYWIEAIRIIARNDFCTGGGNRGWRADIEYLLREGVALRAHEGSFGPVMPPEPRYDFDGGA